ncbi:hypothetical protein [Streptomyces sp. NPDC056549]|uniref:hypothetical protein n=1 Tax=Streptomyces sp. NPDC056549 TaxID=3345864 RepID=UPI0036A6EE4A
MSDDRARHEANHAHVERGRQARAHFERQSKIHPRAPAYADRLSAREDQYSAGLPRRGSLRPPLFSPVRPAGERRLREL